MEKFFKLKEHGTTVKTEVIAGITTFMTMAYILGVNPGMLSATGMDFGRVFTATALSACIGTLMMALYAKVPFAQAPGMGLNAFFAFVVCGSMGHTWQFALTAVFLEGLIFIVLSFFSVREAIIDSIPLCLKKAISVGIGLFITLIGLSGAGIIQTGDGTILGLGAITSGAPLLAIIGIVITGMLLARNIKGALLIGILVTAIIGIPMGVTPLTEGFKLISMPSAPYILFMEGMPSIKEIFSYDMLIVLFTFLFVDMFDTVGTLVGVTTKAKMLTPDGKVPHAKEALLSDAIATSVGAILGTSTVTTYVESSAGVAEGGRTGLTALVVAVLFAVSLLFSGLFALITPAATASALVLVGLFMLSPIKEINLDDMTEAIPAFITIVMMPFAYSISEGIMYGVISYIILKLVSGKHKEIHKFTYVLGVVFLIKIIFF